MNWAESTPSHFRFAVKLWRGITHYRKLRNSGEFTLRFLEAVDVIPENRRAPLLVQLPPNQTRDIAKLESYIEEFRSFPGSNWRLAVEFRNADWLTTEVRRMLDQHEVALCIHDMRGRGETSDPNDAPFVYIRRHGSAEGRYAGSYSPEAL